MGIRYMHGWDVVNLPSKEVFVEYMMLLAGSCVLFIVGVGDDLVGVNYKWKFIAQIICGCLISMSGLWMHNLGDFLGGPWSRQSFWLSKMRKKRKWLVPKQKRNSRQRECVKDI